MFTPNDKIQIQMDVDIKDAIRALVVLGRSNGACKSDVYDALKKALDPDHLYLPPNQVQAEIGVINYVRIENSVLNHFFNTHLKKVELNEAVKNLALAQSRVDKLKSEIGV